LIAFLTVQARGFCVYFIARSFLFVGTSTFITGICSWWVGGLHFAAAAAAARVSERSKVDLP
jgi:hypothetical protein